MIRHPIANLWLLVLTLVICAVLYPLALLGIGQAVFPGKANGSLITDAKGNVVGSRLIAQPFTGDEYFQPRPSAVSYNAAATGGSNWSANNPALRDRVARQLASVVTYRSGPKKGQPVEPDVEVWARSQPDLLARRPVKEGESVSAAFFDLWLQAHPQADLQPVPADLVMASGSGMDPHITRKNALYQLDRVAAKWAETTKREPAAVREEIEAILRAKAEAPLGGLVGVDLVNVLEVNLALRERFGSSR
jgi:K+-transporting ATPase c subunit